MSAGLGPLPPALAGEPVGSWSNLQLTDEDVRWSNWWGWASVTTYMRASGAMYEMAVPEMPGRSPHSLFGGLPEDEIGQMQGSVRAVREAMRAIRAVQPAARLVQTEDLGTTFATHRLAYQAEFENERRFASLDLLTGRLGPDHPMWAFLQACGGDEATLASFTGEPCPPDVIGLNHYVTSDRFLDERVAEYPPQVRGGNGRDGGDSQVRNSRGSAQAGW